MRTCTSRSTIPAPLASLNIAPPSLNLLHFINAEVPMTTHSTTASTQRSDAKPTAGTAAFVQAARAPLIPDPVLKKHGAFCMIDTRFRAAARLLQCIWLRDHDIPTAASLTGSTSPSEDAASSSDQTPRLAFGSILSPDAANAGRNFLSPAIHRLALQEWLLCEDDAAIDDERLFGNALSSMPLVFNLFGPMALDLKLATSVFRALLPGFVHSVERIQFEHSPGRRDECFLADRSAFDAAVHVTTTGGEPGIIYCEVKYSEALDGNPARMRPRYDDASRAVKLYDNPDSLILRATPIEQIWREHMLAQLAVDNGVTPRAVFLAVGPELNRRVQGAFKVYQGELIDADRHDANGVPFVPMTLESVIAAIATAGAGELAHALWARYCDFQKVYDLALRELAGDAPASSSAQAQANTETAGTPERPSARRRINGRGRNRATSPTKPYAPRSSQSTAR